MLAGAGAAAPGADCMGKKLLCLENVCFSYGKEQILKGISFDIQAGEIVGLAGPNGAGKTTILKLIVGLLKPSSGKVEVLNVPKIGERWQGISYMSQNAQQIDSSFPATVKEIVGTGLYARLGLLRGLGVSDREAVDDAIRNVGLERHMDSQITELSRGQLQRAFMARALVSNPSILILDEPTAAVDMAGEEDFYRLIKEVNRLYGVAVLLVSHDVYALIDHTDRLIFVHKEILYDGKPHDLSSKRLLELLFYHKHSKRLITLLERGREKKLGKKAEGGRV